jgi:serine/threonine protein kinase
MLSLDENNHKFTCKCILTNGVAEFILAYLVMEYCPMMDLFTYVAEQVTLGKEALCHAIFLQVINTVNYMHNV